jgi:hypothetical protein
VRRVLPEDPAARRVDRERDPVRRRQEERVVRRVVDGDAVQVDQGSVDGARQPDLLPAQRRDVRAGDAGCVRVVVAAARVPAEARPVAAGRRDRRARARDSMCRSTAAAAGRDEQPGCQESD